MNKTKFFQELAEQAREHIENADPVNLVSAFDDVNARYGENGRPVFTMPQNAFEFTLGFITALLHFDRFVSEAATPVRQQASLFDKS